MSGTICFARPGLVPVGARSYAFSCTCLSRRSARLSFASVKGNTTRRATGIRMAAEDDKPSKPPIDRGDGRATSGMFGIRLQTNGDVIKFGIAAIAIAYAIKSVFQVFGASDLLAGQLTTGFVSVFALLAWVSTYVFRVGTKGMTYAQQLRDYENQVIKKRYEELTEEELAALSEELEDDI